MALTLTQTAKLTKRGLLFSTIFFGLILLSFISYQIYYYQYYLPHKPPPQIKPDTKFGVLPKPKFMPSSVTSSNYSYTLATVTGGLPTDIPKILKVYFIPQLGTTLLASDKATILANSFSFTSGPTLLSQTQYQFQDDKGGQIVIDLDTSNFKFARSATASASVTNAVLDSQDKIVDDFKNYLSSKNLLKDDLKNGRTKVAYDQSGPNDSNTASVSIWPQNIDSLEIETPLFQTGLIHSTVTKGQNETDKYQSLDYFYWSPDQNNYSTYPLKSPDTAYSDLKSGNGVVVIEPSNPQVAVTSVKLAYFESDTYSPYLEPIYVFEGQGFAAYVNAISPDFISQ